MTEAHATVLIVDDEKNGSPLRTFIENEGYRLCNAHDGPSALRLIDRERPDAALLDVATPGTDGFELLRRITSAAPTLPAIVVTALQDRDAKLRGLRDGAQDVLVEPVDRSELALKLRNVVRLKRQADARAERARQLEEANRELELFAARVAHDLRSPNFVVLSMARELAESGLDGQRLDDVHSIVAAGERAERTIDSLLALARLTSRPLRRTTVPLERVIAAAHRAVRLECAGRVVEWSTTALPVVQSDPALLEQVFVNLLSNALKYTLPRPTARIEIAHRQDGAGSHLVSVRDNGVGFDPSRTAELFTPFHRLHEADDFAGSGLGLANVKRIVERLGGSVSATGTTDQGAVFTVRLPG